jgi:hypothetical protein
VGFGGHGNGATGALVLPGSYLQGKRAGARPKIGLAVRPRLKAGIGLAGLPRAARKLELLGPVQSSW